MTNNTTNNLCPCYKHCNCDELLLNPLYNKDTLPTQNQVHVTSLKHYKAWAVLKNNLI